MIRKSIALTLLIATFAGCHRSNGDHVSRFHDDGRAKPTVVLAPIYDKNRVALPWSLADDLTYSIGSRLKKGDGLYLISEPRSSVEVGFDNPFVGDAAWMKKAYDKGEFVVFMELVDHNLHPKMETGSFMDKVVPSYALDVTMRVRIVDLRGETPQIVLQELVHQTHLIPKPFARLDYPSNIWGRKTYALSPIGLAHNQLCKEVTSRIEDYIHLAKSKSYAR